MVKEITKKKRARNAQYNDTDQDKTINSVPDQHINKIITGDSLDIISQFPDNCIDIIITSPPYNFGKDYVEHNDVIKWDDYFDNLFKILDQCVRVLKFGGRIAINIQPCWSDYIPNHHIISNYLIEQQKMFWKCEILWEKNNFNCARTTWGSWKSPSAPFFRYTHEFIEVFCKGSLKKSGDKSNIDISGDDFMKWTIGKWSVSPETQMREKYNHPAMFPEEIVKRLLQLFSYKNDIVLDPFNGAGTTTTVAHKYNRQYIGIDISQEYNDTAIQRLNQVKSDNILRDYIDA